MRKYPLAFRSQRTSERGATLVIVLAILVLIAILIVGFLTRATSERSASASYSATASTRQLADTAVNLVQAQINDATSYGSSFAWASQPGAARVYDNSGKLAHIYRLYSADVMRSDTTDPSVLAKDVPPSNWASSPGLWTDLNAPVLSDDLNGKKRTIFPILDPREPADPADQEQTGNPKVTTKIDGFKIDAAPGATAAQPAPMPARWLYVLQNGQVVSPGGSGNNVTIQNASKDNPIVGRIAFWTDDESSKININTAAGNLSLRNGTLLPAPWDSPRFRIYDERLLFSENQPVSGEYNRYPGHPANTDLSRIFNALKIPNMATVAQKPTGTSSDFFNLLPRLNDDYGSKGGTVNTTKSNIQTPVTAKSERLFSSLGELAFNKDRGKNILNSDETSSNTFNFAKQQLESGKFFLTATSRAPEVTLFGTPRIVTWPIDSDYGSNPVPANNTKLASTFDKIIAFCGSSGTGTNVKKYYFQRHDSTNPTNDYNQIPRNQDLYKYLQRLTGQSIPGFGGNFSSKYSYSGERDQILTEIVDYIRSTNVYDHAINDPAAPRFTPRRGAAGSGQVVPLQIGQTRGLGRMYTISEIGLLIIATADGNGKASDDTGSLYDWRSFSNTAVNTSQSPAELKDNNGNSVRLMIPISGSNPPATEPYINKTLQGTKLLSGEKRLQAMLLMEVSSPMLGFDQIKPNFRISATNMNRLKIGDKYPFPPELITAGPGDRPNYVVESGGSNGFQYLISNAKKNGWNNRNIISAYQFVSDPFTISTATGSLEFGGGEPFTIQILVPQKGSNNSTFNVAQTFSVQFPATTIPIPDLIQKGTVGPAVTDINRAYLWWGFDRRIEQVSSNPASTASTPALGEGSVIRMDEAGVLPNTPVGGWSIDMTGSPNVIYYKDTSGAKPLAGALPSSDVVRTMVAKGGDTRIIMALENVTASGGTGANMVPHPGYSDPDYKLVNSFVHAKAANVVPGTDLSGKLVSGADYDKVWAPKVPSTLNPTADLDWDSGLPGTADGAYANKPDEGNIYTNGATAPYYNADEQINNQGADNLTSYFTANRIIPSAVMFGSLPTGVKQGIPWRTLLFRPQKDRPRDPSGPKDHLLLDLFSMPVVEPYAISEPFSTAGKVNMNYQILPYTYITRNTGVRAVLASELVTRVPKKAAGLITGNTSQSYYKVPYGNQPVNNGAQTNPTMARLPLNLDETNGTLRQFKAKFDSWDIFKSPSEICDVYLVPEGYSWSTDQAADSGWYGDDFALVGDNVRERPYANIYPRLTTQSNTFTVHYTVQALRNANSNPAVWNESKGAVIGEFRGATTIERFIDPSNNEIPDYAKDTSGTAPSLETFYQWRTIRNQAFSQ